MADQIQFRGGTAAESAAFTGAAREITVDTTNNTVRVHDGTTAGGHMLAKQADLTTAQTAQTSALAALGVSSGALHLGTFTGTTIGDNQSVKQILQVIETLLENKASALGLAGSATNLGGFTGSTILDDSSVKTALQALETRLEAVDLDTDDLAALVGIAENVTNLGTFTGSTIPNGQTTKQALQALETATELRATIANPSFTGNLATFVGDNTSPITHRIEGGFPDLNLRTNSTNIAVGGNEGRVLWEDAGGGATAAIKHIPLDSEPLRFFTGGITAADEQLRINANGRVGIGTTNPQALLHVQGSIVTQADFPDLDMRSAGERRILFSDAGGSAGGAIKFASNTMRFFAGGIGGSNEILQLNSDGTAEFNSGLTVTGNLTLGGTLLTSSAEEINILDGVTTTANELNILDGATLTVTELNILDGVTATTAEINILDGVTATTAELNILDGVTSTAAELNLLDGVTATTAELNYVDGVTSNVQTQLNTVVAAAAVSTGILGATPGTVAAQKAVIVDSNKDITGFRNLTVTGDLTVPYGDLTIGVTAITATGAELNFVDGVTSNIQTQLDAKAALAGPTFTGTPAAPTASAGTNTTQIATTAFVQAAVTATIDGAPGALDTLNELAAALGDDANFSTTITNLINANETHIDNMATLTGVAKDAVNLGTFTGSTISDNVTLKAAVQALETAVETKQATDAELTELATMASATAAALADLTEAEVQILDGATVTTAELNILDGVTSTAAELNILDGVTSTAAELNILDGVTSTTAELNILDGVTSTTAELNLLDGVTATTAELNYVDGVTSNVQTQLDAKLASSGAKAALDVDHLITLSGVSAAADNLGTFTGSTISDNGTVKAGMQELETAVETKQAADAELTELATMASNTAAALADLTQAEVQILDGATVTTAELNILDGVTSTAAELNILDGVTSTAAELNILDGVTSTAAELNLLDGVTATTAELNYVDGVTSAIQTQLDAKVGAANSNLTGTTVVAAIDLSGDIDCDGTANLDAVDIDGDVDLAGDLTFSAAKDIHFIDNNAAALEFAEAGNPYLTFVSTDGSNAVKISKNLDIDADDIDVSTQATDIKLIDNTALALRLVEGSTEYLRVTTTDSSEKIDVSTALQLDGAVDINGDLDMSGTVTFSDAQSLAITDNLGYALRIVEGGNEYVRFVTTDGSEEVDFSKSVKIDGGLTLGSGISIPASQDVTLVASNSNALDFVIASGNRMMRFNTSTETVLMEQNIDVGGTANFDAVDIDGNVDLAGDLTFSVAKDIQIVDNSGVALEIAEGSNNYMVFSTTDGSEKITTAKTLDVTGGLSISGTAVTSTAAELNILDGVTSTAAELNILDGVTSTAAELNILDGVTSTAAELNILDGVTASAADINLIDGITNGTVIASKAIITDANKDITGGRHITITGDVTANAIKLGGTGSANTLSDYEEGTFTPTISSGLTSANLSTATGNYTKVGRLVHFNIDIIVNSGTANGDNFQIGNLPFTANNDTGNFGMAQIVHNNILSGFDNLYAGIIVGNTTIMSFKNGAAFIKGNTSGVDLSNGRRIVIAGTYMA